MSVFEPERLARLPSFLEFYRPVINAAQSAIERIQASTNCPWWLAIGSLTLCVRLSMVPFLILQIKSTAPLARAMPDLRLLTDVATHSARVPVPALRHFRAITR